ncbi:tetratricopeptide repeat protein, partial [Singulisphaera rosea]
MPFLRELCKRMSLALAIAPLLFAGCSQLSHRTPEHDSAGLLDSGPVSKVSKRQAADVEIALGRSLEGSGNLEDAESTYRDALKKNPKRSDAEERLAILADQRGATKEASQHFARALKLDPKNPEILCDLGYSSYLQRRWSDAEDYLRKAIALQPRHARSHTNLGLVLARQ